MKFMMMMKAGQDYEAGAPPDPRLSQAIGNLIGEMAAAGVLIDTGGLLPSTAGARVRIEKQKLSVIDGPFAEIKELIGGYAIVRVKSKEEAIEMARRFMQLHLDILGPAYEGECEVRQLFEETECAGA